LTELLGFGAVSQSDRPSQDFFLGTPFFLVFFLAAFFLVFFLVAFFLVAFFFRFDGPLAARSASRS